MFFVVAVVFFFIAPFNPLLIIPGLIGAGILQLFKVKEENYRQEFSGLNKKSRPISRIRSLANYERCPFPYLHNSNFWVLKSSMKLPIIVALSALLLSGCGSDRNLVSSDGAETVRGNVPASCEIAGVISEFNTKVPGSKFVPTDWQPSPDTDLDAALANDGIACTYGIQVAEVGGTILWALNSANVWELRKQSWIDAGETPIDLPGIDETEAYVLQEGTSADEMHVWRINLLIRGVWIQVGASFLQNLDEALPIIKASIEAIDY